MCPAASYGGHARGCGTAKAVGARQASTGSTPTLAAVCLAGWVRWLYERIDRGCLRHRRRRVHDSPVELGSVSPVITLEVFIELANSTRAEPLTVT